MHIHFSLLSQNDDYVIMFKNYLLEIAMLKILNTKFHMILSNSIKSS